MIEQALVRWDESSFADKEPSIDPSISSALWRNIEILKIRNNLKYRKIFDSLKLILN